MSPSAEKPQQFFHRVNANGTFESICTVCFQTVGDEELEPNLAPLEQSHVCDEKWLLRSQKASQQLH
jgi:hypothetical protein